MKERRNAAGETNLKTEMTTSRLKTVSVCHLAVVEITKMLGSSNKTTQYEEKTRI